ncbi:UNVERIFIED_CONTAM: hypothetical protein RMT77_016964 [Armadillidium vulgare]
MGNPNSREEKIHHSQLRKWIDIPSYLQKNPFFKERVFQSSENEEEEFYDKDSTTDDLDHVSELNINTEIEKPPIIEEDSDDEEEFEGFEVSDKSNEKAQQLTQFLMNMSTSIHPQWKVTKCNLLENSTPVNIHLKNISPIVFATSESTTVNSTTPIGPIKTKHPHQSSNIFSPFTQFSISLSNICSLVFSSDFDRSRCATRVTDIHTEASSESKSADFSGFQKTSFRWDKVEVLNNTIINQVFSFSENQSPTIPELEWDDSSIMINESCEDPHIENGKDMPEKRVLEIVEEEYMEGLEEEEITQSPRALRRFLEDNYRLTNISSIRNIKELSPSYSVEGELLLKKTIVQTTDETGESVVVESPRIVMETPVIRPFTRSRGSVPTYDYVMNTPLEWKKSK